MKTTPFHLRQVRLTDGPLKTATDLNKDLLLRLEPDKLLSRFREYAGLTPKAPIYEKGWESSGVSGHTLGHYLSACSMMAASGDERFLPIIAYIVDELEECQNAHGDGYVSAIPRGKEIFQEVKLGDIRTLGFDLNGGWVPLYTIHKLFAGLRDAYRLTDNQKALEVETKLGLWLDNVFAPLSHEQMHLVMRCEFGGMNEVLTDLAVDSRDSRFIVLANRLYHEQLLEPLVQGRDELSGRHANTQIPKIVGAARQFEVVGELKNKQIAENFWDTVVHQHSYVIGGNSLNEHFGEPGKLNNRLGEGTCETCNTYNMLKLTKHLFGWHALAEQADYYERAMYNHILASQHKKDGRVVYCLSLEMGGQKHFKTLFEDFTCCNGTGLENHSSYNSGLYYHDDHSLFIAQYAPSVLTWSQTGMKVTQETNYPLDGHIRLSIQSERQSEFTLHLRYPHWATQGMSILVNGEAMDTSKYLPSSFVQIERHWEDGDVVDIHIPMSIRTETMPDNPKRIAFLYGPLVLAGDLGELQPPREDSNPINSANERVFTPVLIASNQEELYTKLLQVEGEFGVYQMKGLGNPRDIKLIPFYQIYDRRYTIYWDLFTQEEWNREEQIYKDTLEANRLLEEHTVVFVQTGEMQPERDYEFKGDNSQIGIIAGRKYREAWLNGWFSYQIDVLPTDPVDLVLTYSMVQEPVNQYDILIDGHKLDDVGVVIAEEMNRFVQVSYSIPVEWTMGKRKVTLKFQSKIDRKIAKVFGVRLIKRESNS
jgi:DUF1680 family protein